MHFLYLGLSALVAIVFLGFTNGENMAEASEQMIWFEPVESNYDGGAQRRASRPASARKMRGSAHASERPHGGERPRVGAGDTRSEVSHRHSSRADERKKSSEHKHAGRIGTSHQRKAYVRMGRFPLQNRNVGDRDITSTNFWLEMPDNSIIPVDIKQSRGSIQLVYKAKPSGYYRLVGYNGNNIENRSRQHLYSFYNFMRHGDKVAKKAPVQAERKGYQDGRPVFELVRLYDSERHRFRSRVGHTARVRVLFKGQPVPYAPLTLTTSKNWSKTVLANERGEAEFVLIKDDFQEGILNKRKATLYMLQSEYLHPEPGQFSGQAYDTQRYVATLSFRVSPDSNEWKSRNFAFLIAMITIIGAGAAIAVRRGQKRKYTGRVKI